MLPALRPEDIYGLRLSLRPQQICFVVYGEGLLKPSTVNGERCGVHQTGCYVSINILRASVYVGMESHRERC